MLIQKYFFLAAFLHFNAVNNPLNICITYLSIFPEKKISRRVI